MRISDWCFVVNQTTADEMRISDWSSDVCSSDLPDDVATHPVPFARAFKTAILFGMAYEQVVPGQPLINSALWIIPRMVQGMGLQTVIRRQGKQHLSPMEQKYVKPVELITGFRPCQWLVG